MDDKLEKYLLILLIFLFGIINIGIALTAATLMLDFNGLVKEQLIEIIAAILVCVLFNFALLVAYKDEGKESEK